MRFEISRSALDEIEHEAAQSPLREVCGLLFGNAGEIVHHQSCRNVAADPRDSFEIDPAALIGAYRATRLGRPPVIGCYHSHPSGLPEPSLRDAASAEPNRWLWLIVADGRTEGWLAVSEGARHGRFDAVTLAIT